MLGRGANYTLAKSCRAAQGKPFAVELEQLTAGGRDDPLVQAALTSLPGDLAREVSAPEQPRPERKRRTIGVWPVIENKT